RLQRQTLTRAAVDLEASLDPDAAERPDLQELGVLGRPPGPVGPLLERLHLLPALQREDLVLRLVGAAARRKALPRAAGRQVVESVVRNPLQPRPVLEEHVRRCFLRA